MKKSESKIVRQPKRIGLEFIANVFEETYKDISEEIGISPKTMNDWVKGRSGIPAKHLKTLSELFKIREELFSKELTRAEKVEVNIAYLESTNEMEEHEELFVDDDGIEHWVTKEYNTNQSMINFLEHEYKVVEKIDYIENIFNELIDGIESQGITNSSYENERYLDKVTDFIEFMEDGDTEKIEIMSSILYYFRNFHGIEKEDWVKKDGFITSNDKYKFYIKLSEAFSEFEK